MNRSTGRPSRTRSCRRLGGLAALLGVVAIAGGCATGEIKANVNTLTDRVDKRRVWLGKTFVDVVDATDKAFGEPRVEDREQIVRAKVGIKAEVVETEETNYTFPANFRIPLPAIGRKANIFIDLIGAPDPSDIESTTSSTSSSLSATILKKLTDTFDVGGTLGVHGGPDIGPEVFLRYERNWQPWKVYAEQRGYWRTQNGWGGETQLDLDYRFADSASYIRFRNTASYYEEQFDADLRSTLLYRRRFYWDAVISGEVGVIYNPYQGDPSKEDVAAPGPDEDRAFVRVRTIGKLWRPWLEWELMPGYYYKWEQPDPWRWGVDLRVSIMYESILGD